MALYDPAYEWLKGLETWGGSMVPNPDPTRNNPDAMALAGINSAWYPEDYRRIVALPMDQRDAAVKDFYQHWFWEAVKGDYILSQCLANKVLDSAVNQGQLNARKALQRAVNVLRGAEPLVVDGILGPKSLTAINAADPQELISSFTAQRLLLYAQCEATPEVHAAWMARAQKPC